MTRAPIIKVAINTPVDRLFDYRLPTGARGPAEPGMRVKVPFGRRQTVGIIAATARQSDVPPDRLKAALELLDSEPLLDVGLLEMLLWSASYYQHAVGEVIAAALPTPLRQGASAAPAETLRWGLTAAGREQGAAAPPANAVAQRRLLTLLETRGPLDAAELRAAHAHYRGPLKALIAKGWVQEHRSRQALQATVPLPDATPPLNDWQSSAIDGVPLSGFAPCLLEGVTGSGKTEVYLHLIMRQLAAGRRALVIVPEIGLTPQLLERFARRLQQPIAVLHSGLTDTQRAANWIAARNGEAAVIVGTRSAIFAPLPEVGLIVVDEEHDGSFKQQDGFRYSARDLAVWRARQLAVPVVLGSATPALESLHNALEGRYRHLRLPERPGNARQPDFCVIDLRVYPPTDGLSQPLLDAMRRHLLAGDQALVYLNRRGYAPVLMCPDCGSIEECSRCDARLVLHQSRQRLVCHHCGAERTAVPVCPDCQRERVAIGQGTERLETALQHAFPNHPLVRIDRDSTRKRGELERKLAQVRAGDASILLGTQMLTKGHDFPNVTCVAIVDADQGLFGTDFRSSERMAQSTLQVAGRAGRADKPGEVWLQSWQPEHPLLQTLISRGYEEFAQAALAERRAAGWPPYAYLALLRAEHPRREQLFQFLEAARASAEPLLQGSVRMLGPASAPMEKRAGRYRGQLLIAAPDRRVLQQFVAGWRRQVGGQDGARKTRWSLDIDPFDLF